MPQSTTETRRSAVTKAQIEQIANFRFQLRLFLRFSEQISRRHGVTPLQYQLLLQVGGFPERDWATIGELAERLQARHNAVVSLVTRCESLGLVIRASSPTDRREVHVRLTKPGNRLLEKLAHLHRAEHRTLQDLFPRSNTRAISE